MENTRIRLAAVTMLTLLAPAPLVAAILPVPPGSSVQEAIDVAAPGDVVLLSAGTYTGSIDFAGKAVTVAGVGPDSVVRGSGTGPVVSFATGEGASSVLANLTVTGGLADRGGGIYVAGASPTIVGNVISGNRARMQGSGVYLEASSATLQNNLIVSNGTAGGDPHTIEIQAAAPTIVNNTIVRGDSNGLILRGPSPAVVMNNIIAFNGARIDGDRRGRGICDFSGGLAVIHYNLFYRNRVGALLTNGTDFRRIRRAEREIGLPRLVGNVDGRPEFHNRRASTTAEVRADDFILARSGTHRATDAGNPDPAFDDPDGTRNDIGFTGGPLAPAWLAD
jgi:parallel beta-helix repeat protein